MQVYYHNPEIQQIIDRIDYLKDADGIIVQHGYISDKSYPVHTHNFDELVIIAKGSGKHFINNQCYPISAGDVFVLKGDDLHSFEINENLQIYNICYSNEKLSHLRPDIKKLAGYHALFVLEPLYRNADTFKSKLHLNQVELTKVIKILEVFYDEFESAQPGSHSMLTAIFSQLIVHLSRIFTAKENKSDHTYMMLAKAISYIESNYTERITLKQLALMANISISHFSRVFNNLYKTSPIEYIIGLRIKQASELLVQRRFNITEVALQCGFESPSYFSRIYKKYTGVSPNAIMKD